MKRPILAVVVALVSLTAAYARATPGVVAVIVGVNTSVDHDLPTLRYADDDAVLYRELFRQLGATTFLLSRLDDNTHRLHAEAAADARPPSRAELDRAISAAAAAIAAARASGSSTAFYFVYAGHGNVRDGQAYIGLEDDRLTGVDLKRGMLDVVAADQAHLIIDACYSGLLASARGPGGERRRLHGFSRLHSLANDDRIGLLLSTSSARESHEWEGFQAGVFSYEVRSGMYGAADADGDGYVSYREIAAFVARANAAIPNERFRPDVYARPPRSSERFLDLRDALHRRLEIEGSKAGHYILEDGLGVRVLDFHNAVHQRVAIVRPDSRGDLFLRRIDDNQEYRVAVGSKDVLTLEGLDASAPRVILRGAAHESFSLTFSLHFDDSVVRRFGAPWLKPTNQGDVPDDWPSPATTGVKWQRPAAMIAFGMAGGASLTAVAFALSARSLHDSAVPDESQSSIQARNSKVAFRNSVAKISGGIGVATITAGVVLLLWPAGPASPRMLGATRSAAGTTVLTIATTF